MAKARPRWRRRTVGPMRWLAQPLERNHACARAVPAAWRARSFEISSNDGRDEREYLMTGISSKVRVPDLALMKERGERIVMLTAYDATLARLFDRAGIDLLLVGDSLGHVILGLDSTIPVTLDAIVHHARAVSRVTSRALVVADMPFLTYQISTEQAMQNAARLFQERGAAAVK